jgi:hypothetical protein
MPVVTLLMKYEGKLGQLQRSVLCIQVYSISSVITHIKTEFLTLGNNKKAGKARFLFISIQYEH